MSDFTAIQEYVVENISRPVKYIIYKLKELIRVTAKFMSRSVPSGAASGYATIEKIEGNTVKFNQLVLDSRLVSSGTQNGLTIQRDGFNLSITGTPLSTSTYIMIFTYPYVPIISGHTFYIHIPPTNSNNVYFWVSGGEWLFFSRIITINANHISASLRVNRTDINVNINGYVQIIDLTLIFGAGNEPTTVADFEAWMAQNGLPMVADYNAGELISCKMSGMQTKDANSQTLDTIALDVTTITGINTATNVREVIFPNGMKQADQEGAVKDEIDLMNGTATVSVKRIDIGTLNWVLRDDFSNTGDAYSSTVSDMVKGVADTYQILCDKIVVAPTNSRGNITLPSFITIEKNTRVLIYRSTDHTLTQAQLISSLSGIYVNYPLSTPITYTDIRDRYGNKLNGRYKVESGGTENILPQNTSTPISVAPIITTTYNKES